MEDGFGLSKSLHELNEVLALMNKGGAQFLFVVFSKQDLLPEDQRNVAIQNLTAMFEEHLKSNSGDIYWKVCDLPGFSSHTQERIYEVFDIIRSVASEQVPRGYKSPPKAAAEQKVNDKEVSDAKLIEQIREDGNHEIDAENFWSSYLACKVPLWNHRSYLRSGYLTLLKELRAGHGIFDAADLWFEHLQRMKASKLGQFQVVENRTLAIFWLFALQAAILRCKETLESGRWPSTDDFQRVLLSSPDLMNDKLWEAYYHRSILFSQSAKVHWRSPNLQPLPTYQPRQHTLNTSNPEDSTNDQCRLMRFGFNVVQKYITSTNIRRGWLVKQALASLQSMTMRRRAKDQSIPPYSETQAYFWVQLVHAALASVYQPEAAGNTRAGFSSKLAVPCTDFDSFRVLFELDPTAWQKYYSTDVWGSMEARISFVNPDLGPLPNVIKVPNSNNLERAMSIRLDRLVLGIAAELPPVEDLMVTATILVEDAKLMVGGHTAPDETTSHGQLLFKLYRQFSTPLNGDTEESLTDLAAKASCNLYEPYVTNYTIKVFWIQQVLAGCVRKPTITAQSSTSFENFILTNLFMVYEGLPLCYYTPELLYSYEASNSFLPPNRRPNRGHVGSDDGSFFGEEPVFMEDRGSFAK